MSFNNSGNNRPTTDVTGLLGDKQLTVQLHDLGSASGFSIPILSIQAMNSMASQNPALAQGYCFEQAAASHKEASSIRQASPEGSLEQKMLGAMFR